MKNLSVDKGGYFFKVVGGAGMGITEQYTCAVCGNPAISMTFGEIQCTNSLDNCVQGGRPYALQALYLEPYNPAKHGR